MRGTNHTAGSVRAMRDVPVTGRAPAPDLARGAALLLIAVANAHTFVTHRGIGCAPIRSTRPASTPGSPRRS